jgi:hypothetical protein
MALLSNSTITVQDLIHYARTIPELTPVLPESGWANAAAIVTANEIMQHILAQPLNWKFNRQYVNPFLTVSLQQDYIGVTALRSNYVSVLDMGWLEACTRIDINNTAYPKPLFPMEADRDLPPTYMQTTPFGACWLPIPLCTFGAWQSNTAYPTGLGAAQTPASPIQQIVDPSGNYLFVTGFGVSGQTIPNAGPNAAPGSTVQDNTVTWTVADPRGVGIRLGTLPPLSGIVWQVNAVYQMKPPALSSVMQTIAPVPNEYSYLFRTGFIRGLQRNLPNGIREHMASFQEWLESLNTALRASDRELDNWVMYPGAGITGAGAYGLPLGPANPYSYGQW